MSKKAVVAVVVIVVAIPLVICMMCGGLGMIGVKTMTKYYDDLSSNIIVPACESATNLSEAKYEELFTSDYRKTHSIKEAQAELIEAMPTNSCSDFELSGIIDMAKSGMTLNVENINGDESRTLIYPLTDGDTTKTVKITFEKEDCDWKIDEIVVE